VTKVAQDGSGFRNLKIATRRPREEGQGRMGRGEKGQAFV
tara:strand:+ start:851 stop:970 length:120 start_codon:yes stop_codon:yes gene_type:complete